MNNKDVFSFLRFRHIFLIPLFCVAGLGATCHHEDVKRDLSTDPPRVDSVNAKFLANPTKDGRALVQVKMAKSERLPAIIELDLEEGKVQLRDDGQHYDTEARDGVYTAITNLAIQELTRNQDRWQKLQERYPRLAMPIFFGREQVETLTLPKDRFKRFEKGKNFPVERWGFPVAVSAEKSLLIKHPSVVEDPARTFDPCRNGGSGTPLGKWTFGFLMTQIANQPYSGIDPADLVLQWVELSRHFQTVNEWLVFPSQNWDSILNAWPRLRDGRLDLARAPFKLLAIVNRVDLRDNLIYGGSNSGEARFVFGFQRCDVSPTDDSRRPPLTVILEYGIKKRGCNAMKDWAGQWSALGNLSLGSQAYNNALEAITDQFTLAGVAPEKPNGSALNQLRTNGGVNEEFWQFREFRLLPPGARATPLLPDTVKQSPDVGILNIGYPNPDALSDFVNENTTSILVDRHVVPLKYQGQRFRGGSWNAGIGPSGWNSTSIVNREARHKFALQTCNGCHSLETGTPTGQALREFFHIAPAISGSEALLSGFMTGIDVPDPFDDTPTRHFAELDRRAADLDSLVNDPCLAFTDALDRFNKRIPRGPIPLGMVH